MGMPAKLLDGNVTVASNDRFCASNLDLLEGQSCLALATRASKVSYA